MDPAPQEEGPPTLLDLALLQGKPHELEALRRRVDEDPLTAIEFAETRALLERMLGASCEPAADWSVRLGQQLERAHARRRPRSETAGRGVHLVWPALLAAGLFVLLALADPLGLRKPGSVAGPAPTRVVEALPTPEPFVPPAWSPALAAAQSATERLASQTPLAAAWDRFVAASGEPQIPQWLSPRNAVAVLQLDHELRQQSMVQSGRSMEWIAGRLAQLCASVKADLRAAEQAAGEDPLQLAAAVQALALGDGGDAPAIAAAAARLVALLPELDAGPLGMALSALGEAAIRVGGVDPQALREHGQRLVDGVLAVNDDSWTRRRPRLLQHGEAEAWIGESGRFLRYAPAFFVDGDEALAVRLLALGHLQERLLSQGDSAAVLAAVVYGYGDLLEDHQREDLDRRLRRWRPAALAGDLRTLHQVAAVQAPHRLGYARFRLDLRRLAAHATPASLADRANLGLCLAASLRGAGSAGLLSRD